MPFQLSPGVNVTEIDLTTIVPAVASSDAAIAGVFNWGPVGERILIDSETKLVDVFGRPSSNNAETFFTAANFLSYSNRLYVVRAANTLFSNVGSNAAMNSIANTDTANAANYVIKNNNDFLNANSSYFGANVSFVAKYPGALGNSLKISVCDSAQTYLSTINLVGNTYATTYGNTTLSIVRANTTANLASNSYNNSIQIGDTSIAFLASDSNNDAPTANAYANVIQKSISSGDYIVVGNSSIGLQYMKVANTTTPSSGVFVVNFVDAFNLSSPFAANPTINNKISNYWEYFNVVDGAPIQTDYQKQFGNSSVTDAMHVVVVDEDGKFTGVPGSVLETFQNVSRATDAKTTGGAANYFKTVINQSSKYVWCGVDRSNAVSNTAVNLLNSTNITPLTLSFDQGSDGYSESSVPLGTIANGYDMFRSSEDIDISLILQGKPIGGTTTSGGMTVSNYQLANYLIDNIAETRKDCVVCVTPDDTVVASNYNNEATALVNWRNVVHDSSYAIIDSGYKYQYDRYNDVYRYIPTNGDIAGLCARTDNLRDPWWSPAGFNRGQIKNLVRMRYNARKSDRDILYKNGINPVVAFPGQGTVLFGDKTLQSKPSAFDHINVRRLFIVLEKAIATAAKFTMFEFNDEFTRAQFKNLVTPYLRDVQGRRGITDFLVVCDSTNNTPERVDRNEFWGDIYIKPARSINFIQLNFVAVRSGVQFSEIVGQF